MCLVGNKRADIARVIPCKNNFCTKFAHRFHFCGLQKLNTLNLRLFHPPLNPCNHFPTVLIKTNWYTISYKFCGCSKLEKATFQGELPQNTINCGLPSTCIFYVPKAYYQNYKDALGSKYSYIYPSKDDESGEDKPNEQCAVPTISYADGKLTFACSTPNAEYHYTITDTDMASDTYSKDGIVKLYAAYNISVYATADGYMDSDRAIATLYWIEANLQNNTTNINQTATRGIIATSNDGIVTLSGLNNSEIVRFYTVDGKQIGTAKAINGTASQAVSESIVIAKIGNQTIKIAVK